MTKSLSTAALAAALVVGWLGASANASSVSVTYTTITSDNTDTGGPIPGVVLGLVKSTLGPNGLPVEAAPGTFTDVDAGTGELQWWTPHSVSGTPFVLAGTTFSYPNPATLPFNITSDFFPNGLSGSNGGAIGFTSAILSGTFVTPAGGSVTFDLGSDDDAWVFLNGTLVVDNGGVHAEASAPTTISGLLAGMNTLDVFFADRHITQSGLFFNASVELTATPFSAVPEPSTWAMMLVGFAGLGYAGFRSTRKQSSARSMA
jgi:fibro-slime domain-containing protein